MCLCYFEFMFYLRGRFKKNLFEVQFFLSEKTRQTVMGIAETAELKWHCSGNVLFIQTCGCCRPSASFRRDISSPDITFFFKIVFLSSILRVFTSYQSCTCASVC